MSSTERIPAAAQALFDGARQGEILTGLPAALQPAGMDEAYAVQQALQALWQQAGAGAIAGWKVALTSPVMQELLGVDQPCEGAIFARRIHQSPARLAHGDYVNPGVESEIAVRLARDLPAAQGPYDRGSVADAVAEVMPAIELVDDRAMDYGRIEPLLLIADNAWNAGCVLGPACPHWRELDLAALKGRMEINGEVVGEGVGGDALGHPFEPLAWLANNLNARGGQLNAGDVVMTGSIVATKWLKPGDRMATIIDELGEARLELT